MTPQSLGRRFEAYWVHVICQGAKRDHKTAIDSPAVLWKFGPGNPVRAEDEKEDPD